MSDAQLMEKYERQAKMLANKAKKKYQHLRKRFASQNIEVFRLYDWDIPEVRAVVDWYAGHLVIAEYTRRQTDPRWLPIMGKCLAKSFDIPNDKVHLKERRMGNREGARYERLDYTDRKIIMSERDLKFYVNPYDYVDTGLFSDHRNTRQMVRDMAKGKAFLNLYCYTGSFSCYAAKGGAKKTVSVDRSETAVDWAKENMALNEIPLSENTVIQSPVLAFLERAKLEDQRYDLAVVDPPSFSTSRNSQTDFDISTDHPGLLRAVLALMKEGSTLFFSTNHQDFKPAMDNLNVSKLVEITSKTIPEDYVSKNKKIHRCWKMVV